MTDEEIAELIRAEVAGAVAVYRFGSTVSLETRSDSDIDLALLGSRPLNPVRRFDLQERLAARLGRDVDLVDLCAASTVMRMQVISTGCLLADYVPAEREAFEDHTFSAYARLNEERRSILEQVRREGSVHGR